MYIFTGCGGTILQMCVLTKLSLMFSNLSWSFLAINNTHRTKNEGRISTLFQDSLLYLFVYLYTSIEIIFPIFDDLIIWTASCPGAVQSISSHACRPACVSRDGVAQQSAWVRGCHMNTFNNHISHSISFSRHHFDLKKMQVTFN
jgi:hypothetical protein